MGWTERKSVMGGRFRQLQVAPDLLDDVIPCLVCDGLGYRPSVGQDGNITWMDPAPCHAAMLEAAAAAVTAAAPGAGLRDSGMYRSPDAPDWSGLHADLAMRIPDGTDGREGSPGIAVLVDMPVLEGETYAPAIPAGWLDTGLDEVWIAVRDRPDAALYVSMWDVGGDAPERLSSSKAAPGLSAGLVAGCMDSHAVTDARAMALCGIDRNREAERLMLDSIDAIEADVRAAASRAQAPPQEARLMDGVERQCRDFCHRTLCGLEVGQAFGIARDAVIRTIAGDVLRAVAGSLADAASHTAGTVRPEIRGTAGGQKDGPRGMAGTARMMAICAGEMKIAFEDALHRRLSAEESIGENQGMAADSVRQACRQFARLVERLHASGPGDEAPAP